MRVVVGEETMTADPESEQWLLLLDPAWSPSEEGQEPPVEAVVGMWPVLEENRVGKFRGNPEYRPTDENSPADPLDAVLRLMIEGSAETEQLQAMLCGTLMDVAMNGDGRPLVMKSPDDIRCVVVATAGSYRDLVVSPSWLRTDLAGLIELLEDQYDVLFNSGGPASVRLTGDFLRMTGELSEEELEEIQQAFRDRAQVQVVSSDAETPAETEPAAESETEDGPVTVTSAGPKTPTAEAEPVAEPGTTAETGGRGA
ncbi:type VII secretion system-associated protein [Amycolatopsis thailandensis]|uniref:type VII secretion system-associated protein n=1 Tax=Amycolatopsis thailandensis TaxID=589330 RepID=UPI001FC90B22|nr:type VII secretion system-associated protein [Amycolatopsis thailandensis]